MPLPGCFLLVRGTGADVPPLSGLTRSSSGLMVAWLLFLKPVFGLFLFITLSIVQTPLGTSHRMFPNSALRGHMSGFCFKQKLGYVMGRVWKTNVSMTLMRQRSQQNYLCMLPNCERWVLG